MTEGDGGGARMVYSWEAVQQEGGAAGRTCGPAGRQEGEEGRVQRWGGNSGQGGAASTTVRMTPEQMGGGEAGIMVAQISRRSIGMGSESKLPHPLPLGGSLACIPSWFARSNRATLHLDVCI